MEKEIKRFVAWYAGYHHHKGVKSTIRGTDIIDALKKSNQNAIVVRVIDEDGTVYVVRERENCSPDKYYHNQWIDENGKILFDEHVEKYGPEKSIKVKEPKKEIPMKFEETKDYQEAAGVNAYIKEGEIIGNPIWQKWYEKSGFKYGLDAYDTDFEVKIPQMIGDKVYFKDNDGKLMKTRIDLTEDGRRKVSADIRSWVGISPGAIHYYTSLKVNGGWLTPALEESNMTCSYGGKKFPEYTEGVKVEITKQLTKEEKENWPDRWDDSYDVGDNVNAFEEVSELKEKIKTEFDRIFGDKDWKLEIND